MMNKIQRLLDEQQRYYRERSAEYGEWIADYMQPVRQRIIELMWRTPLGEEVLEIACGTGYWTAQLSAMVREVTALDGAREMLDIVAGRNLPNVILMRRDLFRWTPERRWDSIFFVHWLAHVPPQELERFWATLRNALRPGGKVIFVDVTAEESRIEEAMWREDSVPVIRRRLNNGKPFTVVKTYWEPSELLGHLRAWGWSASATPVGADIGRGFVYYVAEDDSDNRHRQV